MRPNLPDDDNLFSALTKVAITATAPAIPVIIFQNMPEKCSTTSIALLFNGSRIEMGTMSSAIRGFAIVKIKNDIHDATRTVSMRLLKSSNSFEINVPTIKLGYMTFKFRNDEGIRTQIIKDAVNAAKYHLFIAATPP